MYWIACFVYRTNEEACFYYFRYIRISLQIKYNISTTTTNHNRLLTPIADQNGDSEGIFIWWIYYSLRLQIPRLENGQSYTQN